MSRNRFVAASVTTDNCWRGYEELAVLCEESELTEMQAQVVLLRTRGVPVGQMPIAIGVTTVRAAYYALQGAVRKLSRRCPEMRGLAREAVRDLLTCFRNYHGSSGGMLTYDQNGRPVTLRAKLVTEDDFLTPAEILAHLPQAIAQGVTERVRASGDRA